MTLTQEVAYICILFEEGNTAILLRVCVMKEKRENWIDNIKIFACILVAVGHLFQSMCASGIMNSGVIYQWFNRTIYYFHVPLFFICSGYVYQKNSTVNSFAEWRRSVLKKMITLGIPYFVFSLITWGMKKIFSDNVNSGVHGLGYDLFIHPMSPYWYLFAIFFIFLITGTLSNKKICYLLLLLAILLRITSEIVDLYVVRIVLSNQIWFVIGMAVCKCDFAEAARKYRPSAYVAAGLFLILSVWRWEYLSFLMGLLACYAVMIFSVSVFNKPNVLAEYTMPVFLMHTIFAAGVRVVILKLGIAAPAIHVVLGLGASFLGPIVAAEVMKKLKLDILYQPGKYIKINK